ncbi:uncharacterized protein LOC119455992 [Dermacentor silvarum]|uniref:uncharacterized protein LOC119455992 n=1 Tax=Dermacentor silvarum TaxID=543639 RepID=UPI001898D393|nr:uncharacterized protein LOC119455992 [Dermacentor silvarum]
MSRPVGLYVSEKASRETKKSLALLECASEHPLEDERPQEQPPKPVAGVSRDVPSETDAAICDAVDCGEYRRADFHASSLGTHAEAASCAVVQSSPLFTKTVVEEETDSVDTEGNFREKLRMWAVRHNIKRRAVSDLLKLLRSHPTLAELPEDGRTLLRTPRQAQELCGSTPLEPGEYCHFGLKAGLLRILRHVEHPPSMIPLSFNIDGLPLSKSSRMQLWPIQCIAHACGDGTPFLVGAFAGPSKPASSREFLRPFVVELQELISEGVVVDGSVAQVSMAYAIVEFLTLDEVEVVPSTWIKGNRCVWPPEHIKGDKVVTMVKKAAMPDASWKRFEVSVKGLFETYDMARRKLNRSERDSDLNTDSDVPRKRSRKPPQPWSDSDDSQASQTAKTQQKGAVPVPSDFPLGDIQESASVGEKDTSCVG